MDTTPLIIMGVQGTGKSTIGAALAQSYGMRFIDGDDLHPASNKEKMASGTPLTDEDREPWLRAIGAVMAEDLADGRCDVIVCSALKRAYRDLLRSYVPNVRFVHLHGSKDLIASRIAVREHEYMPTSLLDSQFATLEPLGEDEAGVAADVAGTPDQLVAEIRAALDA